MITKVSLRSLPQNLHHLEWIGARLRSCLGILVFSFIGFASRHADALTITVVTSDNGYPAHLVTWTDASGQPRSATMVDQNSTSPGPYAGYMRRYTYKVNGETRTCTGTYNYATNPINLEFSGEGFVQNHLADGEDDSSGNNAGRPGTTTISLQGSSHALITYTMTTYAIAGSNVPTSVQWFFADGRDHPVFSISQDARDTPGNLGADSRSPYGDMAYDGDGLDAIVGGFSYGDTYKFVTLAAGPEAVTSNSPWKDIDPNTIPYTMQWANPAVVDAEMGHVATLPITVSDQGQDTQTSMYVNPPDLFDPRNKQSPGPLPAYNTYSYQIINYSLDTNGDQTDSKRLAWGAQFGRVGGFDNYGDTTLDGTQYSLHSNDPLNSPLAGTRVDGLLMAYSTFIVLGTHNGSYLAGAVGQCVTQMENTALAAFTAATGTVAVTGPAGIGPAANASMHYSPAGYNSIYSAWEVSAAQNLVTAMLTPASGKTLVHPVIIVDGYTGTTVPTISVNGSDSASGYFATLDKANQRLWVTLNTNVSSALTFQLTGATPPPPPDHPPFFTGEEYLGSGTYYLAFTDGQYFGYYGYLTNPNYIYHQDLGYEYVFDAADGQAGVYLYDFKSNTFFYTSPVFPFPYLYDFTLNSTLYYYPDPSHPGHYDTNGVRYFYEFKTGKIISK